MDESVRVVIAEDSTLLRVGMVEMLERVGFSVVRAVVDKEGLLTAVRELQPDLVITDIRMPPSFKEEGLEAVIELRRELPHLPVVALSNYISLRYVGELLDDSESVGTAYLLKDRVAEIDDFVETLHSVVNGGTVVDPKVIAALMRKPKSPTAQLSAREREVLALVAEGHSNASISRRLVITEAAVAKHIGNVFLKLDLLPNGDQHRRVLAVLTYLRGEGADHS